MINTLNPIADNWWTWQIAMLWQTAVLIGIIWIVDLCIRKWAWPQVRYALWMLVLVKLLIPPTWTSPASVTSYIPAAAQKAVQIQIAPVQSSRSVPASGQTVTPNSNRAAMSYSSLPVKGKSSEGGKGYTAEPSRQIAPAPDQTITPEAGVSSLSWKVYAMFGWLAGMMILAAWLILRLTGLRREHLKTSNGFTLPERFYTQLEEVAGKLNLRRLPQVVLTDKVACPAVFGIFRPVLLMPAEKLRNMSRQDTEHILLHELAHIKRGDLFVHAVYMLLQIAYWFNPLLWMVRRPLQNLRELCCDATVARLLRDKTCHYRETLLETARQLLAEPVDPGLGLLGLFENSNWLVTRLKWLEKNTWKNRPLRIATIILLVSVMTTCVLPMGNRQTADINDISPYVKEISGYRIEFVAVNHFESESGWWRPDGSLCDKKIITEDKSNYQYNYPGYEFIFKIDGVMKPNSIRLDVKGRNQSSGLTVLEPEGLIGWRNHIKPRYTDTTAKIGILGDNWETIDSHTGYGTTNAKVGGKKIIFSPASGSGNEFSITVSDELSYDLGKRIVAVGKDGKVYSGTNIGGLYVDDLHQNTFRFKGVDRDSIKEFQFQTQQYQWITFKNVSLRPKEDDGFKVTGTVKDDQTGEPIAGAEVYDDGYNNNKYQTTTDKNGNFTLSTANEEHNISAKAEGYQPKSKGLYTFPFANNKDFDFSLVPAAVVTLDQILKQAEIEARQLNHEYIGTEHLLLALVSNEDAAACAILKDLGIDEQTVRCEIGEIIKAGSEPVTKEKLQLNQRAKKAIGNAKIWANSHKQDTVTSVDLLLGLLTSRESVASGLLNVHGVHEDTLLQIIRPTQKPKLRTKNYKAILPNGVTVELLGVCDFDLENQQCWKPDGNPIDKPLFVTVSQNGDKQYHTKAHGFIIKTDIPCEIQWLKASGQKDQFGYSTVVDKSGKNIGDQNYYGRQLWLDGREQTDLIIKIAPEKWKTKAVYDGKYIIGQADERVRFIETYDSADGLKVVFQSDFDDMDIRLDALVKGSGQSIVTAEISTVTDNKGKKNKAGIFKNMGLSQILNFQFKIRSKMEMVTFKNVSLRPGGKTEVEGETEQAIGFSQNKTVLWRVFVKETEVETCFVDFDKRTIASQVYGVDLNNDESIQKWAREHGYDALVKFGDHPKLIGYDTAYLLVSSDEMDDMSVVYIDELLRQKQLDATPYHNGQKEYMKYAIRTREGAIGWLRMASIDDQSMVFEFNKLNDEYVQSKLAAFHKDNVTRLRFHILPNKDPVGKFSPMLSEEQIADYRMQLRTQGPAYGSTKNDVHRWLKADHPRCTLPAEAIVEEHSGMRYVLVCNWRPRAMLSGPQYPENWHLTKVETVTDARGHPAIRFELDEVGQEQMEMITGQSDHIGRSMAIVLNGKVISAPRIQSKLSRQGMIVGNFTEEHCNEIVDALKNSPQYLPGGEREGEIKQVVASSQKAQGEEPVDIAPAQSENDKLLLGPNGTGYFDRNATIQFGQILIKVAKRIEARNIGSDIVEIKTDNLENKLLLGPNGTGYFDSNSEIQIGDAMIMVDQRIQVVNTGSDVIKIVYY